MFELIGRDFTETFESSDFGIGTEFVESSDAFFFGVAIASFFLVAYTEKRSLEDIQYMIWAKIAFIYMRRK